MTKIKISVIKRFRPEDVFGHEIKKPNGDTVTICTSFKDGQEFIVEGLKKPEDFCGWAWHDLYKDVCTLNFGGDHTWTEDNVMYTCCTDGIRPVCFKIERIES